MQVREVHKQDALGRVEKVEIDGSACARRVAVGGSIRGSAWIARRLLARERRALHVLAGLPGIPVEHGPQEPASFVRAWVEGLPLARAPSLPEEFFGRLDELVLAVHARRVCHSDLRKEPNVLVGTDGRPWLIDFQLASMHTTPSRAFETRQRDDLRRVEKHRRRYTRPGLGPNGVESQGAGRGIPRSRLARVWRSLGKPAYVAVTRGLLGTRDDGDAQGDGSGPWPVWTAPVGARVDANEPVKPSSSWLTPRAHTPKMWCARRATGCRRDRPTAAAPRRRGGL